MPEGNWVEMKRMTGEARSAMAPAAEGSGWQEFYREVGPGREAYARFRSIVFNHYLRHRRDFSWRRIITPYRVFVSEVMLQQTQTTRVAQMFEPFVAAFDSFDALAEAGFAEILRFWKGLGYNRRARYLQEAARQVVSVHQSVLPNDPELLVRLPGIGPATAASICVFAFDRPIAFIETNIRTVFIHFFFAGRAEVDDREIIALVERTIDREHPREWFYALMDYGVMLKKTVGNLNRNSKSYSRQSRFQGSDRQLRGRILQLLLDRQVVDVRQLPELLGEPAERCARLAQVLSEEGIVVCNGSRLSLD